VNGAQGGLLMILAAIVLFVLWTRGYLEKWLGGAVDALSGSTTAKPLNLSLSASSKGTAPRNILKPGVPQ
jgi:hypothetical protein